MGELGFLGLNYPEEYGGQGGDALHGAVFAEEMARCGSGGVAAGIGGHVGIAMPPILKFGTDEQKQRWLVPGIKGEQIGALAITEPGAGSDVAGLKTFARRDDGDYVVNGSKTFITNGVRADFYVTAVKTTQEGGHHGLSFLVLEKGMPGFEVTRKLEKLGWHASDTGELSFSDVRVPDGEPARRGEQGLLPDHGQLPVGAARDGARRRRRDAGDVRAHARVRARAPGVRPPDRPLPGDPAQARRDGDARSRRRATSPTTPAPVRHRPGRAEGGLDGEALRCRAAVEVADEAVQIHGGYGYMREYDVERALRDARLGPIGGGTDEIMKEIIGKQLGL